MRTLFLIALLASCSIVSAQTKFTFSYKNDLEPAKVSRTPKADIEVKDSAIFADKKLIGFVWNRQEVIDGDSVSRWWFFYPNGKPLADLIIRAKATTGLLYTDTDSMEGDVDLKKVKPEKMKDFLVSLILKKNYL